MTFPLLDHAKRFVAGKNWQAALVLELGADLAVAVNKSTALSGQQKSELVIRTILELLDDVERAGKSAQAESTAKGTTTTPLAVDFEALRSLVKNVLPVTLSLVVGAARGKFDLQQQVVEASSCIPVLFGLCFAKNSPLTPSGSFVPVAPVAPVLPVVVQQPVVPGPVSPAAPGTLRLAIPPQQDATQPPKEQVIQEATQPTPQS